MTTAENEDASDTQASGQTAAERDRSATRYPFYDLEEAERFAKAVRETGGNEVLEDDLLKHLGISRTTKSWIYKLSTAREFGLIERKGQKNDARIVLTDLARRLLKPANDAAQAASRIAAFLAPVIYKKLFKHYEGGPVPQVKFLGNVLEREPYGLLESVSDQAATAFLASARHAGLVNGDVFVTLGARDAKASDQPPPPPTPPLGGAVGSGAPATPKMQTVHVPADFIIYKCKIERGQVIDIPLPPAFTKTQADKLHAFLLTQVDDDPKAAKATAATVTSLEEKGGTTT